LVHPPSGVRVTASESRSQHRNRDRAFERLIARLQALNRTVRPRVPTPTPRAAQERRLGEKKRRQAIKRLRAVPGPKEQ
jgi:protein subunit release factor A